MRGFCVHELTAGYGGSPIIDKLSFHVEEGCLMGILGANGSGKTTLLKAICGILPHTGSCSLGNVELDRLSAREIARLCSYIPQRSGISIDLPVIDVVLMGFNPRLRLLERPNTAMQERAREALSLVGLAGREQDNYQHLSEGQKQLCILARTLVSESRLLLLDEPESALDLRFRHRMLRIIRDWTHTGQRIAAVTLHDPALALNCCDALLLIRGGKVLGTIHPAKDPLPEMEALLSALYGPITLSTCRDKTGKTHLIMLKEEEDEHESDDPHHFP